MERGGVSLSGPSGLCTSVRTSHLWRTSAKASRYMWFFATCTKTFAGPQTKSFFGREHFETAVCAPYDSVALEFGRMCGHLNGPPAAQTCPSLKCVALLEVNRYLTYASVVNVFPPSDLNSTKYSCPKITHGLSIQYGHDHSFLIIVHNKNIYLH